MHELIKEIERQLEMDRVEQGNMSAEDVLYIVKGFKRPYLNENQQIVLDWLKTPPLFPISAVYLLEAGKNVPENVKKAYENFDKKEEVEVLQAFSQWSLEQEE
ncbi:hypothetical protein [Enterococcus faecalis]